MSHRFNVLVSSDERPRPACARLGLLVLGCLLLPGVPSVVHGQAQPIPQYPTTVDPYEVIVFEHEDYTGYYRSFKLDPTKRQLLVPFLDSSLDDRIRSFRVGEKVGVMFFTHQKFQHFFGGGLSKSWPLWPPTMYEWSRDKADFLEDVSSLIVYQRAIGPAGVWVANDPVSAFSDQNHKFYPLPGEWSESKICWKSLQDLDEETEYVSLLPRRGPREYHYGIAKDDHPYLGHGKVFVTLYDSPECQGDWITLPGQGTYSTEFELAKYDWDDKARSLEVRWEGPVPTLQVPVQITGTATVASTEHVRAPAAPSHARAPSAGDLENGVDRPGADLRAFDIPGGPEECRQACAAEPQCRAFTWVRPGVQGPQARCWLKSGVPAAVPNGDCVSGVKTGQSASGMMPVEPAAPSSQQQAPAPVVQAAGVGFPMLAEITLAPGDPPATYRYAAATSGPHRLIAAWGSPVGIRLEVYGDGPDPWVAEGNPATVRFECVGGMDYRVRLSPAGSLPVTSVLQLHGGPVK